VTDDKLLMQDLTQAAMQAPPREFRPGVIYVGNTPSIITTEAIPQLDGSEDSWTEAVEAMGVPLPEGFTLQLVEALYAYSHNPASWHRDKDDRGANHTAYTAPNTTHRWRYKFKVVLKSLRSDPDLDKLQRDAIRAIKGRPLKNLDPFTTMVINLADFQTGKVDELGGTPELLERSEHALQLVIQQAKKQRPSEIVLIDVGDSSEGFESSPNAARTSDLQQTEQIRAWRRILWRWIKELAKLGIRIKVVGVPSNHCRVRKGKDAQGPPLDDWGIEVISQVADIAAENPERFGHVEFVVPREYDEHVTLTLAGGKILSAAHGHQVSQPKQLTEWAKKQGRREIGLSDIVVVGHFHHLHVETYGDDQTLFICPTNDGGSSWFTPQSGERSRPGILTFMVDSSGWRDMFVAWTA
jgi:hypothetical protein